MGNTLNLNLQTGLKAYIKCWKSEELLFSYGCKVVNTAKQTVFHLHQLGTNLSIEMGLEEHTECLRLNSFLIKDNESLERTSESLYDAALIELVLQALDVIYFCAHYGSKPEVAFFLTKQEAAQLDFYSYLFSEISIISTAEGRRKLLILPASKYHYEEFLDEKEDIESQVQRRMWVQQKSDPLIRQYLQVARSHKVSFLSTLLERKEKLSVSESNVVSFPRQSFCSLA
ncbi:hypothetical protein [Candidatus Odyssella thessalonicensis]|uniref:hypothetical protein n=1 Tax=Candidatus Odyssella thessalonicensis TaxID=84647 RepID=UPI000225BD90|nr:hypothetical protein [Candidatus Odyssella thessalonicensis]